MTGEKCVKSKRRRSGATSDPACFTCVPSTWRSAACIRWVAVWLRRVASRNRSSTCAVTLLALVERVGNHRDLVAAGQAGAEPHHALHARDDGACLVAEVAGVGDLAAGLQVERRAVEQHVTGGPGRQRRDLVAIRRRAAP